MGFARRFIGGTVVKSNVPPSPSIGQWIDISSGQPIIKIYNDETKEWNPITSGNGLEIVEVLPLNPTNNQIVVDISSGLPVIKVYDEPLGIWEVANESSDGGGIISWNSITDKPTQFNPTAHTHNVSEINGLESAIKTEVALVVDSAPDTLNTLNELSQALNDDPNFATNIITQLGDKVDKVVGKQLSSEDYTTTEKTKLTGIEDGAEKNKVNSVAGKTGDVTLDKSDINLGNVDNTSDLNKPISIATQTALDNKANSVHNHTLSELDDVDDTSKADKKILQWNATTSKHEYVNITSGDSVSESIFDFYKQSKSGKKIVMVGDSTTEAATAMYTRFSNYYTKVGGLLDGATIVNRGVGGGRLEQFVNGTLSKNNINTVIADQAELYVFCYGINDIRTGIRTFQQIKDDLKIAIDRMLNETSGYILLRIPNTFLSVDSNGYITPISKSQEYSSQLWEIYHSFKDYSDRIDIIDTQSLVFGRKTMPSHHLMSEAVHPNDNGYQFTADIIAERISNYDDIIEYNFKNYDFIMLGSLTSIDNNNIMIQPSNLEQEIKVDDIVILGKSYSFLIDTLPQKEGSAWKLNVHYIGDYSKYGVVKILRKKSNVTSSQITASQMPIVDSNNNLSATNVEDAITELFTYANNGKNSIATAVGSPLNASDTFSNMSTKIQQLKVSLSNAITEKGVVTHSYNTIDEMANNILVIPTVSISGTVKSTDKLNITAPYTHEIILNESLHIEDVVTTVLQYTENNSGVVHYNADYNNGESSNFTFNPNYVVFDGFMKLKDEWIYNLSVVQANSYFESDEIDFSQFTDFGNDLILDIDTKKATIKGLQSTSEVIIASGNISLIGVESIDNINWTNIIGGDGISRLAISFDNALTWKAFNGTEWIDVDINNEVDFKSKGMNNSIVDTLTNVELSVVRGDSNVIRFAYYIERPTYLDDAKNDSITMSVTMKGYNIIAPNSSFDYSYDSLTRKLSYNFKNSGTYKISYVDSM